MTPEALAFLATEQGAELLAFAATLPADRLTRLQTLRRKTTPEIASSVVSLLETRHRARSKFPNADTLFLTPEGYEQASSTAIAMWRAAQYPPEIAFFDACCGIGSDAQAFAEMRRVLAVDSDPTTALCARLNLREKPDAATLCADVTRLDLLPLAQQGVTASFFDPSRRVTDAFGRRVRASSADDYSPALSYFTQLAESFPYTAAKVSPAISDETLLALSAGVEFVSYRGECKEAIVWSEAFGRVARPLLEAEPHYTATILAQDGTTHTLTPTGTPHLPTSQPQTTLYEPDPAVIRAHLVGELAEQLDAAPLDSAIAYLTADALSISPFAQAYTIHATCPMDKKTIQRELRQLSGRLTAIKKRGVDADPEVWRKQIKDAGDQPFILFLTRIQGKQTALFCTLVQSYGEQ